MGTNYHTLPLAEVISRLGTDIDKGLAEVEARKRLEKLGANQLSTRERIPFLSLLFSQFKDFMVMVLMLATVLSALIGHTEDALTIMVIVLLNGILGFIQEYRAEKSLALLKELSAPQAKVLREDAIKEIEKKKLVPGDIMILAAGDRVGADGRVCWSDGLEVEESIITGESLPVSKEEVNLRVADLPLGDRVNMVYSGTLIARGQGKVIVTATGMETEMGRIARLMETTTSRLTPLQKRLKQLGHWLVALCFLCCLLVIVIGVTQGQPVYQMVMTGISLAVAAIPEGLTAIVTLALALGVQRMIRQRAIIRELPAVETLGCTTVICTDKTGTITTNSMEVAKVYYRGRTWGKGELADIRLLPFWQAAAICTEVMGTTGAGAAFIHDPTDRALLQAAEQAGVNKEVLLAAFSKIKIIPFCSMKKQMTVLGQRGGKEEKWIKGAPEVVLPGCCAEGLAETQAWVEEMAAAGLRVIAFGRSNPKKGHAGAESLEFLGLVALWDPPRPEVFAAIDKCRQAGIKVMMVTGDHQKTAVNIARQTGILAQGKVWSGADLHKKTPVELFGELPEVEVLARVNPSDKLEIIRILRRLGQVVAMTGDGINDAPALKEADIGIAMGRRGTEVAREASSLILADDNFATIVKAVEEGRIIYNNIRKFIRYLLACNIGEIIAVLGAVAVGLPLPLLPAQILWVNLVTDGLPALALGVDPPQENIMKNPPRNPREGIFAGGMAGRIISQGLLIGLSTLVAFIWSLQHFSLAEARTVAFTTLVLCQLIFAFSCAGEQLFVWQISMKNNRFLVGAVVISLVMHLSVLYSEPLKAVFLTQPLPLWVWVVICNYSLLPVFLWELGRYIKDLLN